LSLRLLRFGQHTLKQVVFQRHCVSATLVCHKEFAIAVELAVKRYMMIVVVAMEGNVKRIKAEAFVFLSVPFCFFNLPNQAVVHF
jgi:hypothetical protein